VLAGATPTVDLLRSFGAARPFVIGASRGMGRIPTAAEAEVALLDVSADSMMASIRASENALQSLPGALQARIDRWDPSGEARTLGPIFGAGRPVAGRSVLGARPVSWQALEDKTVIDAVWDAVGVARVTSRVVPLAGLREAARAMDLGQGTVWAGDAREGFHGGASFTRWIRDEASAAEAEAHLATACDRARVMPFLEGIPCSIHGVVFPDHVVALRPCEMLVFRSPASGQFTYARSATFWDPPPEDAAHMRTIARAVGAHLRRQMGYRGTFTIDGVMTSEGFRPTELNPRIGAALGDLCEGLEGLPIAFLNCLIVEGLVRDYRPEALERMILDHAASHRSGRPSITSARRHASDEEVEVVFVGDSCRTCVDGEVADAQIRSGPSAMGTYVRVVLNAQRTPVGPSVAPRVGAALAFVDRLWGLGLGTLVPARDVRGTK